MRKLIYQMLTIYQINYTIDTNRVIFYLKRIPLIKRIVKDNIYSDGDLKLIYGVISFILSMIKNFGNKAIYLGLMLFLPIFILAKELTLPEYFPLFVQLFIFLSLLAGTVQKTVIFDGNRMKFICVKMLHFPTRDYFLSILVMRTVGDFILFLPSVLISFYLMKASAVDGVFLCISLCTCRMFGESIRLFLFRIKNRIMRYSIAIQIAITLIFVGAGYSSLYFGYQLGLDRFLFDWKVMLILMMLLIGCGVYLFRYHQYYKVATAILRAEEVAPDLKELKREMLFAGVEMKEADFRKSGLGSGTFEKKIGYAYLNAIFFRRHRKLLEKPILIRIGGIGVVLAVLIGLTWMFPSMIGDLEENLLGLAPAFVFLMYQISLGDRICKAMFNNCDVSLLRYSFYRKPKVILENFLVRLRKITALNLLVGMALCMAFVLYGLLTPVHFYWLDLVLLFLIILCLAVFFSVHHLFLYYVFQPYSTDFGMKNPFFKIIHGIVYILCFASLQLKHANGIYAGVVILATLVYICVALILVYRYAPKTFRVK